MSVQTENPVPSSHVLNPPSTVKTKTESEFRDYDNNHDPRMDGVRKFYWESHRNQTLEYVLGKKKALNDRLFGKTNPSVMSLSIWEAMEKLDLIVDDSDPDTSLPQTAEAIRNNPDLQHYDWLPLVGLIHDLGKVMLLVETSLPQWSVVGDTFPVGCRFDETCIYHEYFAENPDSKDEKLGTKLGIYSKNCGFDNVHFSYGHDEFMYQVCVANQCKLPEEALHIIRYHSFYPWHSKNGYDFLSSDKDKELQKWLKIFQQNDLYSKLPEIPDMRKLKAIYDPLIHKYFPTEKLLW